MSEWTAEDVLSDSRRLRGGQPIGDTTLAGLVDRVCTYCDAYAARLEADAQPVDDAAVQEAVEQLSRVVAAMEIVGGYENTVQGAQTLYTAYRAKCLRVVNLGGELLAMQRCAKEMQAERDEARAEVELLRDQVVAKGESHARAVRDYNRVCRQLEVDGKIHDATVERLTARVGELEGLLELRHKDHECPLKNEYQCPYVENRHGHDGDVETAYRTQCATVERVTARVMELEVELENAEQKADDWYKWYSERESEIERLTTELATAQALAGAPAPDAPTGTCSGEPPLTEKNRRNNG